MADKPKLVTPPPVQVNARRIVAVGTALFFLGFVVLLFFYDWLGRHHDRVWLWTCLAGAVLGVAGYLQMLRHKRMGRTI
jgi:hypothetical protein